MLLKASFEHIPHCHDKSNISVHLLAMKDLFGTTVLAQILVLDSWATSVLIDLARNRSRIQLAMRSLVLLHGGGRQSRRLMMDGRVVVLLMDRYGGMDNLWLDGLLLDDGLDVMVDMVMGAFSGDNGRGRRRAFSVVRGGLARELGRVLVQGLLDFVLVTVINGLVIHGDGIEGVLLGPAGGGLLAQVESNGGRREGGRNQLTVLLGS